MKKYILIFLILTGLVFPASAGRLQEMQKTVIAAKNGAGGGNVISASTNGTSIASTFTTNNTTLTITAPAAASVDGRIMYAAITSDHATAGTISAPAGWTQIGTTQTSSSSFTALFYKITSSEGASYAFTRTDAGAVDFSGVIIVLEKTAGTWDPDQSVNQNAATGASITSAAVTSTDGSMLVIAFGDDDASTAGSVSGSMTCVSVGTHSDPSAWSSAMMLCYEPITTGASEQRTWTPSASGDLAAIATVLEAE